MSAFSRGCSYCHPLRIFLASSVQPQLQASKRAFLRPSQTKPSAVHSLQIRLFASKKAARKLSSPRTAASRASRAPPASTKLEQPRLLPMAYANSLAARAEPTLLYLAPESPVFPFACITISALCFSYAGYHLHDAYVRPHPGLLWIIPHLMAGVSVFMAGCGLWVGLGAWHLVRSVRAIPTITTVAGQATPALNLRIQKRSLFPVFGREKTLERPVEQIKLGTRISGTSARDRDALRRGLSARPLSEGKMAAGRAEESLKNPLVKSGPMAWVRRIVSREGFTTLIVDGQQWKMDTKYGWCLDDGLAFDRLLKIRGY